MARLGLPVGAPESHRFRLRRAYIPRKSERHRAPTPYILDRYRYASVNRIFFLWLSDPLLFVVFVKAIRHLGSHGYACNPGARGTERTHSFGWLFVVFRRRVHVM